VEQQNIERSLAVILWQELCDEIQKECRGVNSVTGQTMVVERSPINIAVTDMNTRKLLQLSYQETGPLISDRETGKPDTNITLGVEQPTAPSLTLMSCGIPQSRHNLAVHLMIELTRF
jgi:hypothetical protein